MSLLPDCQDDDSFFSWTHIVEYAKVPYPQLPRGQRIVLQLFAVSGRPVRLMDQLDGNGIENDLLIALAQGFQVISCPRRKLHAERHALPPNFLYRPSIYTLSKLVAIRE